MGRLERAPARLKSAMDAVLTAMFLAVLFTLMMPSAAHAATYTLNPSKDSYLKQSSPSENNGTQSEMLVQEKTSSSDSFRTVYAFDLSSIPAGEIITSATLRLYVRQSSTFLVNVHRTTNAWVENSVNWSNLGTSFQAASSASFTPSSNNTYVNVAITSLAQNWKATPASNHGVMLISSTQEQETKYTSREWGTTTQRPQLVIVTSTPPVLSASLTSNAVSDPVNGTTNPKSIPGVITEYAATVSNTGAGTVDANAMAITHLVAPATILFVGDLASAGSGPVQFIQGTPSSDLSYSFVNLSSTGDSISFSNNGGVSYVYVPVPDGDGFDANITHFRVAPTGSMAGNSSFLLKYRTKLQ